MSSIALDDVRYSRAKALLARELPTKDQESRFRSTKILTLTGFVLGLVWIGVVYVYDDAQRYVLYPATVSLLLAEILFLSNISYLRRLWRSWITARRLGFSRLRKAPGQNLLLDRLLTMVLLPVALAGIVITVASGIGLYVEIERNRYWIQATCSLVFGVMCVGLYPMALIRDRVHAVRSLDAELDAAAAAANDTTVEIQAKVYDTLAEIERTQIQADRGALKARTSLNSTTTKTGFRITSEFFQALAKLDEADAVHVRRTLEQLAAGHHEPQDARELPRSETLAVPSTNLLIELRRKAERRVVVVNLRLNDGTLRGRDV
jgi:hypothetical protein